MDFFADLNQLPQMMNYIREQAIHYGMGEDKIYKLELASEEALVNIISYAYPPPKDRKKDLSIECKKQGQSRFEVTIRDIGLPFNPIDADVKVDVHQPIDQRKVGGLGIYMLRKLVDEISYQREGEENILRIVTIL